MGRKLRIAAYSLLALAVLAEISARCYIRFWASRADFLRYANVAQLQSAGAEHAAAYTRHYYTGYIPTPGFQKGANKHSSRGFRGRNVKVPKPEGETRIVCLGGSTTYSVASPDPADSYPDQLERRLRNRVEGTVRVVNGGAAGWSSWETLVSFLFRVLDLEPDLIVVYHGVNDIHPRLTWPLNDYAADNRSFRAPSSQILWPSWYEHSAMLRMLMIELGHIEPHSVLDRSLGRPSDSYVGDAFRRQKSTGAYPEGLFSTMSAAEILAANRPVYFERNLENLAVLAKYHGIEVVFATFVHFDETASAAVASDEYEGAFQEMNDTVRAVAERTAAHVIDLDDTFPREARYFMDGVHTSVEGSALRGRMIADFLLEQGLVPAKE